MNPTYNKYERGQGWILIAVIAAVLLFVSVVVIAAAFPQIGKEITAQILPPPTLAVTDTVVSTETVAPTAIPTQTQVPTETVTQTATATPTQTETVAPTATITPTPGPTRDWEKEDFFMIYRMGSGSIPARSSPFASFIKEGNILRFETTKGVKAEIEFLERKERQVNWMGRDLIEQVVCYRINSERKCSVVGTILMIFFDPGGSDLSSGIWNKAPGGLYDPDLNIFVSSRKPDVNSFSFPTTFIVVVVRQGQPIQLVPYTWFYNYYTKLGSGYCNWVSGLGNYERRWSYSEADSPIHDVKLEGCPSFEPMP